MKYKFSKYLDTSALHVKIYDILSFTKKKKKKKTTKNLHGYNNHVD